MNVEYKLLIYLLIPIVFVVLKGEIYDKIDNIDKMG
jgi:hypothetical protein